MGNTEEIIELFREIDTSDFPDFDGCKRPLERALWVLWVAKDKLGIKKLTAARVASIIREVKEISINSRTVTNSLNRVTRDKVHTYQESKEPYFGIMKAGKDHLLSQAKEGSVKVFYFEPGKTYTSKQVLSNNILSDLKGGLRIVDPYCGERTLDVLSNAKNNLIKFLTRVENLREREGKRFLRELKDFELEHPNIEFRSYPRSDIHDRYVASSEVLVVLGHSIKDLGAKESFAIRLNKDTNNNIVDALIENFNRRWKISKVL